MTFLFPILGLSFIFLMLLAFYFFDRLLKIQYAEFKSDWEKAGAPHGFFWVPKESAAPVFKMLPKSSSTRARTKQLFSWLFQTPEWIKQNSSAKGHLFKVRALIFISLTLLMSFGILYMTS